MRRDVKAHIAVKSEHHARKDDIVQSAMAKTPAEVDDWIDEQAKTPAGMRIVIKMLARIVLALARKTWSD